MIRNVLVSLTAGMLLVAPAGIGRAGGPDFSPTDWSHSPTKGPSPNATHQVSGGSCFFDPGDIVIEPGGVALGGVVVPGDRVLVQLRNPSNTDDIAEVIYLVGPAGEWGGLFPIPPGLSPGTYPLVALCEQAFPGKAGAFLVQSYVERSYVVVARSRRADPVAADVTFTG